MPSMSTGKLKGLKSRIKIFFQTPFTVEVRISKQHSSHLSKFYRPRCICDLPLQDFQISLWKFIYLLKFFQEAEPFQKSCAKIIGLSKTAERRQKDKQILQRTLRHLNPYQIIYKWRSNHSTSAARLCFVVGTGHSCSLLVSHSLHPGYDSMTFS